jgi:hypothetical protein
MTVDVSVLTAEPTAGRPVDIRIVVSDDARIERECSSPNFGDGGGFGCRVSIDCVAAPGAYGSWAPPQKSNDRYETTLTHTYDQPGSYTATFTYSSADTCAQPETPYRSTGTGTVTITVT